MAGQAVVIVAAVIAAILGAIALLTRAQPLLSFIFEIATLAILFAWWVGWVDFVNMTGFDVAVQFSAAIERAIRIMERIFRVTLFVLGTVTAATIGADMVRIARR